MTTYTYIKAGVNSDQLALEIRNSAIVTASDGISFTYPDILKISFKASLSVGDKSILDALVIAHQDKGLDGPSIIKDSFLNYAPDYTDLKFVKVDDQSTDINGGFVIPVNQVVGIYRVRLSGATDTMFTLLAFDWLGTSQKIIACTRGNLDLYLNPNLAMNQVTGDGLKKLCIVCVNDSVAESPYMGGSFEATKIAG